MNRNDKYLVLMGAVWLLFIFAMVALGQLQQSGCTR